MLHTTSNSASFPGSMPMPREIRALLLDDSNFDRARIRRLSNHTNLSIHLDEVESIAQLDSAVAQQSYDLILIDYRLPVGDGMEALDHIQHSVLNKDAAKIMITGDSAQQTAVAALRSGCHDFLTKEEMDAAALRTAMINAMATAQQHQFLLRQTEQQKEIIRQGLVAAMNDEEVQGNVVSLVRAQMNEVGRTKPVFVRENMDDADLEALLAALGDEDDFIFH